MKLLNVSPMLDTTDLKGSVEFYASLLGFQCQALDENRGWACVSRDEVRVMFALPNEHSPFEKPAFTGSIYFKTDAVDEIWQRVQGRAQVCYPLEDFEYGMREFAIYDNNGYLLQFGQEAAA